MIKVKTYIKKIPASIITFHYEIFNEDKILANIGETDLTFVSAYTNGVIKQDGVIVTNIGKSSNDHNWLCLPKFDLQKQIISQHNS